MKQSLKEKFSVLPETLQRMVLLRFLACGASLLLIFFVAILYRNLYLCLSFVFFFIVCGGNGVFLLLRLIDGRYMTIMGRCTRIDKSFLKKRTKALYFVSETHTVKLFLRQKLNNIAQGDEIIVYVLGSTPVYLEEGCEVLGGYLTIERKTEAAPKESVSATKSIDETIG